MCIFWFFLLLINQQHDGIVDKVLGLNKYYDLEFIDYLNKNSPSKVKI